MRTKYWNCRLYDRKTMYSGVGRTAKEAKEDALRVAEKHLGRKVGLDDFRIDVKQFIGPQPRSLRKKAKREPSK